MSTSDEIRRLMKIGDTPVWQVTSAEREFFHTHPLREATKHIPVDKVTAVLTVLADWLESQPEPKHEYHGTLLIDGQNYYSHWVYNSYFDVWDAFKGPESSEIDDFLARRPGDGGSNLRTLRHGLDNFDGIVTDWGLAPTGEV